MEFLETERLYIRPWEPDDWAALWALGSDPEAFPAMGQTRLESEEAARETAAELARSDVDFAIAEKETDRIVGSIHIPHRCPADVEPPLPYRTLTFSLLPEFRGRGYMQEAVREMVRHIFEDLGLGMLWSFWPEGCDKARRILERADFQPDLVRDEPMPGGSRRIHHMTLPWEAWVDQWREDRLFEMLMTSYF